MTRNSQKLLKEAMEMPAKDRALIAQRLIWSLDGPPDRDVEAAWKKEIDRRLRRFRRGTVQMVPWETIRDRLGKRADP
jgi:putative addiction module component (TIGR02574 family)